eukprot:CAMPEP_0170742362 /NCGR_PEP_ID=MMETSP0437-20130122/6703_1 /TAXON_ID=0 /ORGANISM="Sexangularia sp." /LENGTH=686 /DNA_ID=CAMNT_0011080977 /DNA_START=20 /DNA_END=2076 /DNA_ORIENTATION=-
MFCDDCGKKFDVESTFSVFPGDFSYKFSCSACTGGEPVYERVPMTRVQGIALVMYNMILYGDKPAKEHPLYSTSEAFQKAYPDPDAILAPNTKVIDGVHWFKAFPDLSTFLNAHWDNIMVREQGKSWKTGMATALNMKKKSFKTGVDVCGAPGFYAMASEEDPRLTYDGPAGLKHKLFATEAQRKATALAKKVQEETAALIGGPSGDWGTGGEEGARDRAAALRAEAAAARAEAKRASKLAARAAEASDGRAGAVSTVVAAAEAAEAAADAAAIADEALHLQKRARWRRIAEPTTSELIEVGGFGTRLMDVAVLLSKRKGGSGQGEEDEEDAMAVAQPAPKKSTTAASVALFWSLTYYVPEKETPRQCFVKANSAPQMVISGEHATTVTGSGGYRLARSSHPVIAGTYYYECTVTLSSPKQHVRLGIATEKADNQAPVGYDGHGYGIRDMDGRLFHNARQVLPRTHAFHSGDVVGFLLKLPAVTSDKSYYELATPPQVPTALSSKPEPPAAGEPLPEAELHVYVNGTRVASVADVRAGAYYAAVSTYMGASVTANFGPEFQHCPATVVPFDPAMTGKEATREGCCHALEDARLLWMQEREAKAARDEEARRTSEQAEAKAQSEAAQKRQRELQAQADQVMQELQRKAAEAALVKEEPAEAGQPTIVTEDSMDTKPDTAPAAPVPST